MITSWYVICNIQLYLTLFSSLICDEVRWSTGLAEHWNYHWSSYWKL